VVEELSGIECGWELKSSILLRRHPEGPRFLQRAEGSPASARRPRSEQALALRFPLTLISNSATISL
jgi:hypothetical protein